MFLRTCRSLMNVKFRRIRGYKTKQRSFPTPELFPFAHDVSDREALGTRMSKVSYSHQHIVTHISYNNIPLHTYDILPTLTTFVQQNKRSVQTASTPFNIFETTCSNAPAICFNKVLNACRSKCLRGDLT